jgi:hypothetical protein
MFGNYGARRRHGEPISTASVESAVNEIVSRRMIKGQQMRWNRLTVQTFLDVRAAVLKETFEGAFRRSYPRLSPRQSKHRSRSHSVSPHQFAYSHQTGPA